MSKKGIKIIAIFLTTMFVLTIVSQKMNTFSKAKVKTTHISSGKLDYSVMGQGLIKKEGNISVTVPEGQKIEKIHVAIGQAVLNGEAMFSINKDYLIEQIHTLQDEIHKLELEKKTIQEAHKTEESRWQSTLSQAHKNYTIVEEQANKSIDAAMDLYNQAQNRYQALAAEVDISEDDLREALTELEDAEKNYKETKSEAIIRINQANQEVEQASIPLALEYQDEIYQIEIENKSQKLQELQTLIDNEGEVYAACDGIVTAINFKIGEIASPESNLYLADFSSVTQFRAILDAEDREIMDLEKGIKIEGVDANNEPAVVDDVRISTISYIEEDGTYEMLVNMENVAFQHDSMAKFYFENKSVQYACTVPVSALREDTNGYYILTIGEENTILGSECTAQKIYVEVLEKNSTLASIKDGILNKEQNIITESSKPVDHGSRIRMDETKEEEG